jgi:hypothetical protein
VFGPTSKLQEQHGVIFTKHIEKLNKRIVGSSRNSALFTNSHYGDLIESAGAVVPVNIKLLEL